MIPARVVLSLVSAALPDNFQESLIWDRDLTLPFVPSAGLILVFDTKGEGRIDVIVDKVEYHIGEPSELIVHCRLCHEENSAIARKAFILLKSFRTTWMMKK